MKICHLSSVHPQEDTRIFHKECTSLANAGYDVYLVTVGKTYIKNGVHIVGVENVGSNRFSRFTGTTKNVYLKALELNADVYHAHDPELLPILMKLKNKKKKVIFDSHEFVSGTIDEKEYIPKLLRTFCRRCYEAYEKFVCRRVDAVITATPNVKDYFIKIGCDKVVDLCNFPILITNFNEPNYTSNTISFAGGIEGQWNHDKIINAINDLNNVKYVLCGKAQSDYLESLKKLQGWEKVDYLGKVPFESVSRILNESAIGMTILTPGANTDYQNGNMANTKIFEEMMAGLPVVCTNFNRWKSFVERYDCGICVDPNNEEQIKEAIEYLLSNPDEARKRGLNGRKAIEIEFNWGIEKEKLISLYEEIGGEIGK